ESPGILDVDRVHLRAGGELARGLRVMAVVVDGTQGEHERRDDEFSADALHHARTGHIGLGVVHRIGEAEAPYAVTREHLEGERQDRKSTRLNSSHVSISYAVFCLKKKTSNIENKLIDTG